MSRPSLDVPALHDRLNTARHVLGLSWRSVFLQAGLPHSASLATRLAAGNTMSADTLIPLLAWLDETDLTPYIRIEPAEEKTDA